jgi:hypothetical protein
MRVAARLAVVGAIALTGCSKSSTVQSTTTAATEVTRTSTSTASKSSTATSTTTTTAPTTTASSAASTTTIAAPATSVVSWPGGTATAVRVGEQWMVQMGSIPTVPLPSTTAPNPNTMHITRPEDAPILEAYVKYVAAVQISASDPSKDVTTLFSGLVTSERLVEILDLVETLRSTGQRLDTSNGLTVRPYVLSEPRTATDATVFDCQLDGSFYVDASGSPIPGQLTTPHQYGASVGLTKVGTTWLVATDVEASACLSE